MCEKNGQVVLAARAGVTDESTGTKQKEKKNGIRYSEIAEALSPTVLVFASRHDSSHASCGAVVIGQKTWSSESKALYIALPVAKPATDPVIKK